VGQSVSLPADGERLGGRNGKSTPIGSVTSSHS
jgi:hypothetical protein